MQYYNIRFADRICFDEMLYFVSPTDLFFRCDMKALTLVLAHASADQVNCVVSHRDLRTPLHLACSAINLPIAQLLLWVSA